MENGELKTSAAMRDALLDVAAAANDALYTSHATPEATQKAYADAIDLIRKSVCPPDTFFTPVGLLPALPAPKRDWLDMPGGFRLSLFHVAGRTTFVGARKNHGDAGGNIYVVEVRRGKDCDSAFFKATRNGERLFDGFFYFGREIAQEQAAVGMLKGYLARIEADRRNNKRNKKNRKARKNGELEMENGECGGAE